MSFRSRLSGTRRITMPKGMEIKPSTIATAHRVGPCGSLVPSGLGAILNATSPTKTIRIWKPHMRTLMPMKMMFFVMPSKMLKLLSNRRLLNGIAVSLHLFNPVRRLRRDVATYFHWLNICIQTKVLKTRVPILSSERSQMPVSGRTLPRPK